MKTGNRVKSGGAILDPELKARLQKLADERDIFDYEALEEAVQNYLGEWEMAPRICRVPEKYQDVLDGLVEVLTADVGDDNERIREAKLLVATTVRRTAREVRAELRSFRASASEPAK